ncbi:MAG: terminase small subunit [Magnetococcales bacterium]|nr:terminase small subunit [Magnetococcales bacterium]
MATQLEVAQHLFLSDRQVRNLISSGVLPKHKGRAGYSLDDARRAYIDFLKSKKKEPEKMEDDGSLDLTQERARNLQVDTELKERKRDQVDRTVAPIHLVEWLISGIGTKISAILGAIPQNVKRRVPRLTSVEVGLIESEIVKCQNLAANMTVDLDEYESSVGTDKSGG